MGIFGVKVSVILPLRSCLVNTRFFNGQKIQREQTQTEGTRGTFTYIYGLSGDSYFS